MLFGNLMGKDFDNLGQRMTYVLAVQMSPMKSIENDTAGTESLEGLYAFISDYYKAVFENPSLVGIDGLPDECENNTHGDKPYLDTRKLMRKVQKKITDVFDWLVLYGKKGRIKESSLVVDKADARITKKKAAVLENFGIQITDDDEKFTLSSEKYPGMMSALKYVAGISPDKKSHIYLYRGIFDTGYNYFPSMYREHCTSQKAFDRLVDYCRSNGFEEHFQLNDSVYGMNYRFKKEHEGMELQFLCQYDLRYYYQLKFTFIDDKKVTKWVLENFGNLDEKIQDLFFEKNKKCNKCGWCNQTDKSRPLAFITVGYKGESHALCPYFQQIRCYFLEEEYVDKVLHFYDYVLRCAEK